MKDCAETRRLHPAEALGLKTIARTLAVSRNTVRVAIASDAPPKYERMPAGSAVNVFEDAIPEQLRSVPTMPATVITADSTFHGHLDLRHRGAQGGPLIMQQSVQSPLYRRDRLPN